MYEIIVAIPKGTPCFACDIPLTTEEDKPTAFFCGAHMEDHIYHEACLTPQMKEILLAYQKRETARWN